MKDVLRKIKKFIIGSLLFTGLPLLAWGIRDASGYFENPARTIYTVLMIVSALLVVLFVPNEGTGSGKGEKQMKRQKWTILLLQVTSIAVLFVSPWSDRQAVAVMGGSALIRYAGLVLTFLGYALMSLAVVGLGRQFSLDVTVQKDHQLVTGGLYRYVRHPRYLGIVCFMSGIALVFRSWLGLVLAIVTLAVLIWRISDEEKLMHREFGAAWEDYARKSKRLIPFFY
ncbi:isoprenylcysteine carboxylmethyltransferase family protein [bacterium]|nr:isoprenylcysteine carboxylmethyltransferase family protein [bacterium]